AFALNPYLILFQLICNDISLITFLFKINIITNHSPWGELSDLIPNDISLITCFFK
ncbi:hypothetical protein B0F90DRAFT_1805234, partial [Multifurca ochricompacta]